MRRLILPPGPAALILALSLAAGSALSQPPGASSPPEETDGEITLREALGLALARNPELGAFSRELQATEAAVSQAGVFPNPVVDLNAENLGNSRLRDEGDRTTTVQFGQLVELGGKRAARVRLAETGRELAGWDLESKRLDILLRVSQSFVDVLAAQQAGLYAEESLKLATQVADAATKRVRAGSVSPVEETKAQLALSGVRVEAEQTRRQLASARQRLAATWGAAQARFSSAAGSLEQTAPLPAYDRIAQHVRASPELARWGSEVERRRAGLDTERAKAVPDITLSAGARRFSQFNDNALVLGLSIPLPLFNRNDGAILEASTRVHKAMDEQRAAEARLMNELSQGLERLGAIRHEIEALRQTILPSATSVYDSARKGYELGRFGFLEVLDAQRTVFQARSQYLKALAEYHRGTAGLERLLGVPLERIAADGGENEPGKQR